MNLVRSLGGLMLIGIVAVVVTVVGASRFGVQAGDPHKRATLSVAQANIGLTDVIATLTGANAKLTYQGTLDRPGVRVYSFAGSGFSGYVDVFDGHVALLTVPALVGEGPSTLDAEGARQTADEYLEELGSPIDGMEVDVKQGTGGGFAGYTITYQMIKNGVYMPDYRIVEVDAASAGLISLVDVRRPVGDIVAAALSEADARRIALSSASDSEVVSTSLIVTFDTTGRAIEAWQVATMPKQKGGPGSVVLIDAQTGTPIDPAVYGAQQGAFDEQADAKP